MKKQDVKKVLVIIIIVFIIALIIEALIFISIGNSQKYQAYQRGIIEGENKSKVQIENLKQQFINQNTELQKCKEKLNETLNLFTDCNSNYQKCLLDKTNCERNIVNQSRDYNFLFFNAHYTHEEVTQILTIFAIILPISLIFSLFRIEIKIRDWWIVLIILLLLFAIISMIALSGV